MNSTGQDDQYISRLIQCAIDESEDISRTGKTNSTPVQDICFQSSSTPLIQRSFGANDPFCLNTTGQVPIIRSEENIDINGSVQPCVTQQDYSQFNLKKPAASSTPIIRNEEYIDINSSAQLWVKQQDYSQFDVKKPAASSTTENTSYLKVKNFAYDETVAAYLEDNTEEVLQKKNSENHYFNLFMAGEYERKAASEQNDERDKTKKGIESQKSKDRSSSIAKKFVFPGNTPGVVNAEVNTSNKMKICQTNEPGDEENVKPESDSQCSCVTENSICGTESKDAQQRDPNALLKEADEVKDIREVVRIIKELNQEDLDKDKNCGNVLEPDLGLLCKFCGLVYPSDTELDSHMDSEHPKNETDHSIHEHEREYMRLSEELRTEQQARRDKEQMQFVTEEDDNIQYLEPGMNRVQDKGDNPDFEINNDCTNTGSSPKRRGRPKKLHCTNTGSSPKRRGRPKKLQNKRCDMARTSRQARKSPRFRKRSNGLPGIDEGGSKKPRMVDTEPVHNSEEKIEDADASDDDDVILIEDPIELVVLDSDDSQDEDNQDFEDKAEKQNVMKDIKQACVRSDGFKPSAASPKKKNISQVSSQPNSVSDEFLLQKYGIKSVTVNVEKSPFKLSQSQSYIMPTPSKRKQCNAKISAKVVGQGTQNQADELEIQEDSLVEHSLQSIPDCSLPKSDDALSMGSIRSLSFTKADDQISEISNRSVSPQPSTSSGYIYVPRKRTARKSVKDEALKKQYSLKEVRVMLKSVTSVERALLRNPHSSFGKSDWLHKLQSNTDSDSDDNLDWKAPIMSLLDSDEDEIAVSQRSENSPFKGKGKALSKSKKSQNNVNSSKKCSSETTAKLRDIANVTDWTSEAACNSMKPPTKTRKDYVQGPTKKVVRESYQDEALMKQYGLKEPKILLQNVGKMNASIRKKPNSKDETTEWLKTFHEHPSSYSGGKNDLKGPLAMMESDGKTMALRSHESKNEKDIRKLQVKSRKLGKRSDDKTNNSSSFDVGRQNRKKCNSDARLLKKFGIARSLVVLQNRKTNESTKKGSKLKPKVESSTEEISPKQCNLQRSAKKCVEMNVSEKRKEFMRKVKMRGELDKSIKNNISRQKRPPTNKSSLSLLQAKVREKRIKCCSLEPLTKDKKNTGIKQEMEVCKPFTIPLIPVDDRKILNENDKAKIADSHKADVSVPKSQSEDLDKPSEDSNGTIDVCTDLSKCLKENEDGSGKTDVAVPEGNVNEKIIPCISKENETEINVINTDAAAAFPTLCGSELETGTTKPDIGENDNKGGMRKRIKRSKECELDDSEDQERYTSKKKFAKHGSTQLPVLKTMQLKLKKIAGTQDIAKGTLKSLASEDTLLCNDKDMNPAIDKKSCSGQEVNEPNLKQAVDTENREANVVFEMAKSESMPDLSCDDRESIETDIDKNKSSDSSASNLTNGCNDLESNIDNDLCSLSSADTELKYEENLSEKDQSKQCEIENSNKDKVSETKVEIKVSELDNSDIDKSEKIDGRITKTKNIEGKSQTSISTMDHSISPAKSMEEMTEEEGDVECHDIDTNGEAKPYGSDEVDGMVCSEQLQNNNENINESDKEKDDRFTEIVHVDTIASEGIAKVPKIQSDAEGASGISQDQDVQSYAKETTHVTQDPVVNTETDSSVITESPEVHADSNNDSISVAHGSDLANSLSFESGCDATGVMQGSELANNIQVRSSCSVSVVDSISESVVGDVTIHEKP